MLDDYEQRRQWARDTLTRLGFGLVRDQSGFYRPARLPIPITKRRRRRTPAQQLELFREVGTEPSSK
jgi:hypothetical protein